MSLWFTADLHLRHDLVAGMRGFETTYDHDQAIAEIWQETVHPKDTVWILGDLTLKNPKTVVEFVQALPGTKHLIAGNHDHVHPLHQRWYRSLSTYLEMVNSVAPFARINVDGHEFLLSHFPYSGDHTDEDRYTQYRLPDLGMWLLHGHTHSTEKITGGRQIHVGLDAWGMQLAPQSAVLSLRRYASATSELDRY